MKPHHQRRARRDETDHLIIAAQLVAFWPVWRWYAARVGGQGEEAWGLLALACAAYFAWRGEHGSSATASSLSAPAQSLLLPALLLLVYAASYASAAAAAARGGRLHGAGLHGERAALRQAFSSGPAGAVIPLAAAHPFAAILRRLPFACFRRGRGRAAAAAGRLRGGAGGGVSELGGATRLGGRAVQRRADAVGRAVHGLRAGLRVSGSGLSGQCSRWRRRSRQSSRATCCARRHSFTSRPGSSRRRRGRTTTSASSRSGPWRSSSRSPCEG